MLWIAKQALQTAIPAPWIECQTDEGDVFYYNARTKESVWDHPYDSYYKSMIGKFKSGECSKKELVDLVSQEWLLDGDDFRSSSLENPQIKKSDASDTSPSGRRRDRSSVDISAESPRITVKLSNESLSIITGTDLLHAPAGIGSPIRNRRRSGSGGPDMIKTASRVHRTRVSPQEDISSIQEELESVKETLKINTLELSVAKLKVEELTSEIRCIEAAHKERVRGLTSDLIKAREYIEILLSDNKTLRVRMSDALSRVQSLQTESLSVRDRLTDESYKREIAESRVRDVEEQLLSLDENISSSAHSKSHNILGRLCGSGNWSTSSKQRIAGYDHARSPGGKKSQVRSAPVTPGTNSPDPYKELMQLLAASSSVPPGNPAAATSSRI